MRALPRAAAAAFSFCAALVVLGLYAAYIFVDVGPLTARTLQQGTPGPERSFPPPLASWSGVDLAPFDELAGQLASKCEHLAGNSTVEGHSAQLEKKRQVYITLARDPRVRTICEIGFGVGHSAALWLKANPRARVIMFDLWEHNYAPCGEAFLRKHPDLGAMADGESRLTIVKGRSLETVPQYHADHPDVRCDLISVDGGRKYETAVADIQNMMFMANREFNMLVVDDTNCQSKSCVDAAIHEHQQRNNIAVLDGVTEWHGRRGVTVLQYIFPQRVPEVIRRAGWRGVDLRPFDELAGNLTSKCEHLVNGKMEGHSAQLREERQIYITLARDPRVRTICEVGFNFGHSASLWLKANPRARVIMFDLWKHKYAPCGEAFLRGHPDLGAMADGESRLTIVKGSSLKTVPQYHADHPDVRCDLISVDGGHAYKMAVADIQNMKFMANREFHMLLVDDTNCRAGFCVDAAIHAHQKRKNIAVLEGVSERNGRRGVTVLQYIF